MDKHDQSPRPAKIGEHRYSDSTKPQLPNFHHFVRNLGHPDLAYRGPSRLDTAFTDRAFEHSSLPTPPSANGYLSSWLAGSIHDEVSCEKQSAILEDHEIPLSQPRRRASLVLPAELRPHPRLSRAYSSTNVNDASNERIHWQRGRVSHEEIFPGKGLCYVYDDGSICPKEINGDVVNPDWGVTKAGKPRKRLGQACNSCRQRKTRCSGSGPGYAKCTQCSRLNRECRWDADSSRQGHKSPKVHTSTDSPGATVTHSPKDHLPSRKSSTTPSAPVEASTPTNVVHRKLSKSSDILEKVSSPVMADRHANEAPTPSKRQRLVAGFSDRSHEDNFAETSHRRASCNDADSLGFSSDIDPVTGNPYLCKEYLDRFFEYVNLPTFEIFPRDRFMQWAMDSHSKSLTDRIMMYAMMAWGTVHSLERDRIAHRAAFKLVVYQEIDQVEEYYSLQTVHALLFLAFAEFADGHLQKGFSLFVRCVGAIAFLQLNVERLRPWEDPTTYGFSPAMYAECRRRTFWAAYATDAYAGLSKGDPRILHSKDMFLRLPCATELYEEDRIPDLPFFDQENVLPRSSTSQDYVNMGEMVWLLSIANICSEVQLSAWRSQNMLKIGSRHSHDRRASEKLEARVKNWADAYTNAIRAKEGRTTDAEDVYSNFGESGARAKRYTGLDVLYHYAHMELNRRIFHKDLTEEEILSHAKKATVHAVEVLKLSHQLIERGGTETRDYKFATRGPLAGYAITTAIDIVTAAGRIADILEPKSRIMTLMYSSLELLEHLTTWWQTAHLQHTLVKERLQLVFNSSQSAIYEKKTYFYCSEPMVGATDLDFDLIYGSDRKQYLRAAYSMNANIREREIIEINPKEFEARLSTSS